MNMIGQKKNGGFEGYSHSQFNGFAGEESGFSQYAEESVYNNNDGIKAEKRYVEKQY